MLEVKDKERLFWIYELAQTWYTSGQCSDVILTCLDDQERRVDFSCHKLMVLPLLSKYCSIKCLDYEDIEQVILTDLTPNLLKQYLNYIYGFDISNLDVSGIFNSSSEFKMTLLCTSANPSTFSHLELINCGTRYGGNINT